MKKLLLILFALPFLLNAQNVTTSVIKEKSSVKQMLKSRLEQGLKSAKDKPFTMQTMTDLQAENRVSTYAGAENNLPDSINIYWGEGKLLVAKVVFKYDDKGRILQEKVFYDANEDGSTEENEGFIADYVYTQKGDLIELEVTVSFTLGDIYGLKEVSLYRPEDLSSHIEIYRLAFVENESYSQIEYYVYYYDEDGSLEETASLERKVTEFDTKGRPIFVEGIDHEQNPFRYSIEYNDKDLISVVTFLNSDDSPHRKIEYSYNEDSQLITETISEYWNGNVGTYTNNYEYDEKGNPNCYYEDFGDEDQGILIYLTNFYSSTPDANDVFSIKSNIYPNPVSDVLNVTIDGADNAVITLVNAAGSVVVQQKASQSITSIPVQSFAKGNYFLIIKTDKGIKTHKVIIR